MDIQEKKEYLIGDVARITGVSRDTLRFYEKKGMLQAKKKENGYRYYEEDDIWRLMYVLYHRKMNTSLEEIGSFVNSSDDAETMEEHIARRIREEEEAILRHRRAIARLELTQHDIFQIENCRDGCELRRFPAAYRVGSVADYREALKLWFELASRTEGLDMAYFYNVLLWDGEGLALQETQLLLYRELEALMGEGFSARGLEQSEERDCIYRVAYSRETVPEAECVRRMMDWGREKGLTPGKRVYANTMSASMGGDMNLYALEIYIPLEEEKMAE